MKPQPTPPAPQPQPDPPALEGDERSRFLAAIEAGMADSAAGRVIDDDEVWREMEAKYGPLGDDDDFYE